MRCQGAWAGNAVLLMSRPGFDERLDRELFPGGLGRGLDRCAMQVLSVVAGDESEDQFPDCVAVADARVAHGLNDSFDGSRIERAVFMRPVILHAVDTAGNARGEWLGRVALGLCSTLPGYVLYRVFGGVCPVFDRVAWDNLDCVMAARSVAAVVRRLRRADFPWDVFSALVRHRDLDVLVRLCRLSARCVEAFRSGADYSGPIGELLDECRNVSSNWLLMKRVRQVVLDAYRAS